jgi:hypothetical protein
MDATRLNLVVLHDCAINPSFSSLRMPIATFLGWPDSSIRYVEAKTVIEQDFVDFDSFLPIQ